MEGASLLSGVRTAGRAVARVYAACTASAKKSAAAAARRVIPGQLLHQLAAVRHACTCAGTGTVVPAPQS